MTHLDDGRLRAMMDDELSDSDASSVRLHLEDCNPCVTRLAELEERSALVARALTQLDTAAPPTGAHSAVLERIEASRPSRASRPTRHDTRAEPPRSDGRGRFSRTPFARAAMLTLFLGASVATALPASPVRGWIASGWARAVDLFSSPENALTPVSPPEYGGPISNGDVGDQDGVLPGVRVDITGDEISVVLRGIDSGTTIVVRMVPGREAGASAGDPATFRTAEGRIEVLNAAGVVFVDLPQEATSASIEVNGGIYLRTAGERTDVTGTILLRTTDEIHLRVP